MYCMYIEAQITDYCFLVTLRVTKSTLKRAHSNNYYLKK
jgi:hypothetical protein